MGKSILVFLLAFLSIFSKAQNTEPCYFDKYQRANKKTISYAELEIRKGIKNAQEKLLTHNPNLKIIPVVVHIIHNGGTENISDAQIQSQIDVLNEDYRKLIGTPGDGGGVDTEIEFCLAKKDPQGRCTNGIVRIQSSLTNHQSYQRGDLANLSSWDAARYMNIYVVKSIAGNVLGYASFPGGPVDQDGAVMVHNAFGRIGTVTSPNNMGRTGTHELGHWFGLYHTFNGGCGIDTCADGDLVCDTPPVINPNFGCPTTANTCSNDIPNVNDQVQNYMDYTNDACKSMFTQGQKTRMQATLNTMRTNIWTQFNLISTGCDSGFVSPVCNVVADFTSNADTVCVGNAVLFTNKSLNNPTSYQWSFAGGLPPTSTNANQQVTYNTLGTYLVKLVVTGSTGIDSITINNYITVTNPQPGQALPFVEGFETSVFPPNNITIDNPDFGITWGRDTIAVAYQGSGSTKINNLINTNYGQSDALILPTFDFTSFTGTPYLFFKWAYAKSDVNYSDELLVLISNDCGVNWTQIFYRTGTAMTTGPTQTTPYIPTASTVWKTANINLATYATYQNVQIKIVNVTDGGNNLYIDNINLGINLISVEQINHENYMTLFPNPAKNNFTIKFPNNIGKTLQLSLIDISGRILYQNNRVINSSAENFILPPDLSKGIYFVSIEINGVAINKKLILE